MQDLGCSFLLKMQNVGCNQGAKFGFYYPPQGARLGLSTVLPQEARLGVLYLPQGIFFPPQGVRPILFPPQGVRPGIFFRLKV